MFLSIVQVHALACGDILPCLYILLPNKTQATYCGLFNVMKSLMPQVQPSSVTLDFEKAAMNAMTLLYIACYGHLQYAKLLKCTLFV